MVRTESPKQLGPNHIVSIHLYLHLSYVWNGGYSRVRWAVVAFRISGFYRLRESLCGVLQCKDLL